MECFLFWPKEGAVIISSLCHVVLINFILIRKNQENKYVVIFDMYLITLCKKHVHCDIISTKLQVKFNRLSLSFIDNTKTRISNIVVVYIDAVSIHSFIYIFSKISYKKKDHLQMSIRIGNGTVVND
jgi:hypothetical protein